MSSLYPAETNDGVVTSWIPLATVFTPSAGCESVFRQNGATLVAFDPGYGLDINSIVICAPPAVTTWWEQGRLGQGAKSGHTAVSIGPLTCPDAWTTVASSVKDKISTQVMCCPPDYYLTNGISNSIAGNCRSVVSSGEALTFASTSAGESTSWQITTTTMTRDSIVGAIAVVGWNIEQPTPTASSATSTSSSSTLSTSTISALTPAPTPTSTSSPTSSPSSSGSTTSGGLSTEVAIGIGLGVALGVIGIVALLVALYLMRRRKGKAAAANANGGASPPGPKFEDPILWEPQELHNEDVKAELYAHPVERPPVELYAG